MLLVDALYINNGGGRVLLDYFLEKIATESREVIFLIDARVNIDDLKIQNKDRVIIMKASFFSRLFFYVKNRNKFDTVFCFGNLPPNIRLNAKVFTYFHQLLYLGLPEDLKGFSRLIFRLKTGILKSIKKNTDVWLVQSSATRSQLISNFKLVNDSVKVLPFYPPMNIGPEEVVRQPASFLYVSSGAKYKNHIRLFNAFATFYDEHRQGKLTVTVGPEFEEEYALVARMQAKGYPIFNLGQVPRSELPAVYRAHQFLIFPSLSESFGLGIIEAMEMGCSVLGANLPYMHAVCQPSLYFNPLIESEITRAFSRALSESLPETLSKVHNGIQELVDLLK